MEFKHKSVLLDETVGGLNIKPDGIYVDGTLGGAGHAIEARFLHYITISVNFTIKKLHYLSEI